MDGKADKTDIVRLESKVDKTNGRVTELERDAIAERARDEGLDLLKRTIWRAAAMVTAALGTIITAVYVIIDHV